MRLNRDAKCFFPVESKDCMKSASYEYRKMSARRGAQFVPIGMPTVCWKTFPAKTTKILSTRNSSILMMSSSEYLLLESECSFTKYASSCPNTKYLYLRLPFLKMKAFRITIKTGSYSKRVNEFFGARFFSLSHCPKFDRPYVQNLSGP